MLVSSTVVEDAYFFVLSTCGGNGGLAVRCKRKGIADDVVGQLWELDWEWEEWSFQHVKILGCDTTDGWKAVLVIWDSP